MGHSLRSGVTPVGATLVVVLTATVLAGFLRGFPDIARPGVVGAVGGVVLATAIHLVADTEQPATGLAAGLLVVLAGAAVTGGALWTGLLLTEAIFPVETEALFSVAWLLILGHVGVVLGCSVAGFGMALFARRRTEPDLADGIGVVVAAALVPSLAAVLFLLVGVVSGTTPDDAILAPLATVAGPVLAPLSVVPGWLRLPVVLAAVGLPVAVRLNRTEPRLSLGRRALEPQATGAVVGGVLATVGTVAAADSLYTGATAEALRRFPPEVESDIRELSTTAAASVGESTVVLGAAVLTLGVAALLAGSTRLACRVGLLSTEGLGSSLAAVGLFFAAVSGGTVDASTGLVVAGVTVSLLVWDAGRFGAVLAREVGDVEHHRVELVHLGGVVLVGAVAAVAALLVAGWLPTEPGEASGADLLALCSVVVGLLALVVALR